ncbi:hypothetical protein DFH06DRAFT_1334974 [Mycena polygramma]|nr:hypothetical protein DFH06DRAFT_1334974 [Mycena polygramma]
MQFSLTALLTVLATGVAGAPISNIENSDPPTGALAAQLIHDFIAPAPTGSQNVVPIGRDLTLEFPSSVLTAILSDLRTQTSEQATATPTATGMPWYSSDLSVLQSASSEMAMETAGVLVPMGARDLTLDFPSSVLTAILSDLRTQTSEQATATPTATGMPWYSSDLSVLQSASSEMATETAGVPMGARDLTLDFPSSVLTAILSDLRTQTSEQATATPTATGMPWYSSDLSVLQSASSEMAMETAGVLVPMGARDLTLDFPSSVLTAILSDLRTQTSEQATATPTATGMPWYSSDLSVLQSASSEMATGTADVEDGVRS